MTDTIKTHEETLELYDLYSSGRNPKVSKSAKGYDRVRDRKDKQLYEYESEEEVYDEEETRLF